MSRKSEAMENSVIWKNTKKYKDGKIIAYLVLVGKPEGKRRLGRSRCKWENNIKMDLRKYGVNWIHLAEDNLRGFC
jgi:hypothetical protein